MNCLHKYNFKKSLPLLIMRDNNENYKQKEAPEWEIPVCLWWLGSALGQVRDAGSLYPGLLRDECVG